MCCNNCQQAKDQQSLQEKQAAANTPAQGLPARGCTHMGARAEGSGRAGSCCSAGACLKGSKLSFEEKGKKANLCAPQCPSGEGLLHTLNEGNEGHLSSPLSLSTTVWVPCPAQVHLVRGDLL